MHILSRLAAAFLLAASGCATAARGQGWPPPEEERRLACPRGSRIFHAPDCVWIRDRRPADLAWFRTIGEAQAAGRIPCEFCKPADTGRESE
ncbi:MAG: hypothetical protein N3A38_01265 [Planctomycetota bacterium]|nr:hypothetical protein [Planctomycetota bacterium]